MWAVTIATISIATSESWNDKATGEQKEKTEWHRVVFFKRLAEIVGEWVKRGDKIYVEGRLQTRSWEKDGVKRYSTEVVASEMQMLGSKKEKQTEDSTKISPAKLDGMDFNDDIPF